MSVAAMLPSAATAQTLAAARPPAVAVVPAPLCVRTLAGGSALNDRYWAVSTSCDEVSNAAALDSAPAAATDEGPKASGPWYASSEAFAPASLRRVQGCSTAGRWRSALAHSPVSRRKASRASAALPSASSSPAPVAAARRRFSASAYGSSATATCTRHGTASASVSASVSASASAPASASALGSGGRAKVLSGTSRSMRTLPSVSRDQDSCHSTPVCTSTAHASCTCVPCRRTTGMERGGC
mmetsp:Transcript_56173/g.134694  ORF Transcript_56173/g.134694 Transcript_56173/m.134694 type:complete len:242 (-) Transcript_56173:222-947(-)